VYYLAPEQNPAGAYFVAIKALDTYGLSIHLPKIYNVKTSNEEADICGGSVPRIGVHFDE